MQKAGANKVRALERREKAVNLRVTGATYRQIGDSLGVSGAQAYRIVQDSLRELAERTREHTERLRALELLRLDRWMLQLLPRADPPDPALTAEQNAARQADQLRVRMREAANALLRISERRARLCGLDMPLKVAPTDSQGRDLPALPQIVPRGLDLALLEQGDLDTLERIFEAAQKPVH